MVFKTIYLVFIQNIPYIKRTHAHILGVLDFLNHFYFIWFKKIYTMFILRFD